MFPVSLWAMINIKERTLTPPSCVTVVELTQPYSYWGCADIRNLVSYKPVLLLCLGFRGSCFCREGIQCSMLHQEIPCLPDSVECWKWSEIDQCPRNKTWSSCRRYIRYRGYKQRKTVGHVPKFLTKLTFFFLKNGGKLHITVTGPRRYSTDLKQGGLEAPADYCFTLLNKKLFLQMKEKTLEKVQKYEKQKKEVEQET